MDRRDFLKIMGIATGSSVAAGCDLERNAEKLIPYLVPPEDGRIEGEATFKPTTCTECPAACGVTVRIREDRPVKLDGAEGHPVSDGALCMRGQASLGRLYHTERFRQPMLADGSGGFRPATWSQALQRVVEAMASGDDHLFLSRHTTGSLSALVSDFCGRMGVERLPEYEWYGHAAIRAANRELFGIAEVPAYHIDRADFLLTVGADVLDTFGNPVANIRAMLDRLRGGDHFDWYHAEPHATMTGFQCKHNLRVKPGSEAHVLSFLLGQLRERRVFPDRRIERHLSTVPAVGLDQAVAASGLDPRDLEAVATKLVGARRPLVIAGGVSTAHENGGDVARIAALLQVAAGMVGTTVDFAHAQDQSNLGDLTAMTALGERIERDGAGVVFVHDADPVGQLHDGGSLAASLGKASLLVGIGDTMTETMSRCQVILPLSHALESWGDAEPRRGTINVIQPAFEPLFDTLCAGDILIRLADAADKGRIAASYQEYAMSRWQRDYGARRSRELVDRGWVEVEVPPSQPSLRAATLRYGFRRAAATSGNVLVVAASPRWYDGRSAELPLLREIPDPLTTVTWDRWVSVSMDSAREMGLEDGDELELAVDGWSERLPARRQPGLPRGVFVIHKGIASPPLTVRGGTGEADACLGGVTVTRTGRREKIAIMAGSLREEGRGAVPGHRPAHFGSGHGGHGEGHKAHEDETFNPVPEYPEYRWAMAIDMDLCVGCSACVAACYVENNVPVVGREEHLKGREMAWLRVEPYYDKAGGGDFVPTMCQHCDHAPCESVCPVYATYTNDEGLNAQVYNRCVGTRYCSNNCPYKQRRFNWFDWDKRPEPMGLMSNPDVSMRDAGIMEKCTFCVQRIRKARDVAKDENRKIEDGEAVPACAQACPGNAIVFGNLLDENSMVHKWAKSKRSNRLYEELGTGPAVYYLTSKGNDHGA